MAIANAKKINKQTVFKQDADGTAFLQARSEERHKELFLLYTQTEASYFKQMGMDVEALEERVEGLADIRDQIIILSERRSAKTVEDVLYKMALWRRHTEEIDPFNPDLTLDEKLGYSVFKDLAFMCECDSVFTERDLQYMLRPKLVE